MATIGEQIKAARKAKGMTQDDLAAAMNISRTGVSKWETDDRLPDAETLLRLSRVLEYSFEGQSAVQPAAEETEDQRANEERPAPVASAVDGSDVQHSLPSKRKKKTTRLALCAAAVIVLAAALGLFLLHNAITSKTAELTLTAEQNPAPMIADPDFWGAGLGWDFCFIIRNSSDVAFTPKQASLIFYDDDESVVSSVSLDGDVLRGFMYGDAITNRDPEAVYVRDGANYPKGTHVTFILQGTDANRHELEYTATIALSQEKPTAKERAYQSPTDEQIYTIERFRQAAENEAGKAYLRVNPSLNITHGENYDYWMYDFHYYEMNGVALSVDRVEQVIFAKEKENVESIYTAADLRAYGMETDIPAYGDWSFQGGLPVQDTVLGVGILLRGTDANGAALSFTAYIPLAE